MACGTGGQAAALCGGRSGKGGPQRRERPQKTPAPLMPPVPTPKPAGAVLS